MKPIYYDGIENVGDELNRYIWPAVYGPVTGDDRTALLGVGTLLDRAFCERLDSFERIVVLGSGAGYGTLPVLDDRWHIYAVRGARTCEALRLAPDVAVADAAYLLGSLDWSTLRRQQKPVDDAVLFIPHHSSLKYINWEYICHQAGIEFLSPTTPVPAFLERVAQARHVIAEAMHGAILADVMRVPWTPFRYGREFLDSKWFDWMSMFGLEVEFNRWSGFYDRSYCYMEKGAWFHLQRSLKSRLAHRAIGRKKWIDVMPPGDSQGAAGAALSASLAKLGAMEGYLSHDDAFNRQVERLYLKAALLAADQWGGNVVPLVGSPRAFLDQY